MRKYNPHNLAMRMKYGDGWDSPLFVNKGNPAHQSEPEIPEIIDDATEEKAEIFNQLTITASLEEQRKQVLNAFQHLGEATDNDVARALKVVPSTISARRNELRDQGLIIAVYDEYSKKKKKKDPITGQSNTLWKVKQ